MADDFALPAPVGLQPVASPVETYAVPPRPGRSNLEDLAASLQSADAGLRDFMRERQATQASEDAVKGAAAFYTGNQAGFEEGVRTGAVPAQSSPSFIAGYKKAQGSVAGFDLQSRLEAAYDKWDGKTSDDPQAYTKFATDFIRKNLGANQDPAFLRGLLPHVNSALISGLSKYNEDRHKIIYQGNLNARAAEITQTIAGENKAGIASGKGLDYDALAQKVLALHEADIKGGTNPEDAQKKLIDVVVGASIDHRDPKLLNILDKKVPGQGDATFATLPYGAEKKRETIHKLETMARQSLHDDLTIQHEADKKAKAEAQRLIIDALVQDPTKPIDEALLAKAEKYEPKIRLEVLEWQKQAQAGQVLGDPRKVLEVHQKILDGGGVQAVKDGLANGTLRNPADLDRAISLYKSVESGGEKAQAVLKHQSATEYRTAIKTRTPIQGDIEAKLAGIGGQSDAGLQATNDFDTMILQWATAHPGATAIETQEFIQKAGTMVLKGLPSEVQYGVASPYNRTEETKSTLQEGGAAAAGVPPKPGTVKPPPVPGASSSATTPPPDVEVQQWYDANLTPEQKQAVEADANAKGVPVLTRQRELYGAFLKSGSKGPSTGPTTEQPGAGGGETQPGQPATPFRATLPAPSRPGDFSLGLGDSIAAQQLRHGVPGVEGKMGAENPGATAVVGDAPGKILTRMEGIGKAAFAGQTIFHSPGTSNIGHNLPFEDQRVQAGLATVNKQLDFLKGAGAAHVVIPGVGPGVKDWPKVNAELERMAKEHGYTYFLPEVKWMKDGIHPAEVDKVRQQGLEALQKGALSQEKPITDTTIRAAIDQALAAPPGPSVTHVTEQDLRRVIDEAKAAKIYAGRSAFRLASLGDDPKAASLLDFVSHHEGTHGNYNAVYGNGNSTADLSKLTISQVFGVQRELAQARGSSAIGKYQIIRSTLTGLVNDMSLDPDKTLFTPELQDRLGQQLLETRGYSDWKAGRLSDAEFASHLAQEWASLPDPRTGLSAYHGDKMGNRASTTTGRVNEALNRSR